MGLMCASIGLVSSGNANGRTTGARVLGSRVCTLVTSELNSDVFLSSTIGHSTKGLTMPEVGSLWFKRYPVFAAVIVKVVKVEGDQVTFCDEDDTDFLKYDPESASTYAIDQFHAEYHILGEAN